jgi:hypothetical protein
VSETSNFKTEQQNCASHHFWTRREKRKVCVCVWGGGGGGGHHTPKGTDCTRKVKTTRALEIIAVVARFRNVVENNGCKRQDEFRVV